MAIVSQYRNIFVPLRSDLIEKVIDIILEIGNLLLKIRHLAGETGILIFEIQHLADETGILILEIVNPLLLIPHHLEEICFREILEYLISEQNPRSRLLP
jgi:hypothetical protein